MSSSAYRITELNLSGELAWPNLTLEKLSPELNVFYGPPRSGKSSVAHLIGHLMYGCADSQWRRQFGQTVTSASGSLQLNGPDGAFQLRRHSDPEKGQRLTIASAKGDQVDSHTIQNLLSGLTPEFAARLYFVDFAETPRVEQLLDESFTRDFSEAQLPSYAASCQPSSPSSIHERVDRQRIDQLVQRRDAIAHEVEQQLARRRHESETLQRELGEADQSLTAKRELAKTLRRKLQSLDAEISVLETRLRYYALDEIAVQRPSSLNHQKLQHGLAELDQQITDDRQSMTQLQQRESRLRSELAQLAADGTADSVTCLADSRVILSTMEQLLNDLDAEVSQLARAAEPGGCLGHDSHARLSPVAALLRRQVYALCGQFTEQERVVRRQQIRAEMLQLSRILSEHGERLESLLLRREAMVRRAQRIQQPFRIEPQKPVSDHCNCQDHASTIQLAEEWMNDTNSHQHFIDEWKEKLSKLRHNRVALVNEISASDHEFRQLELQWEQLHREQSELISGASLNEQRNELERLEFVIRQTLHPTYKSKKKFTHSVWRASDVFAQLTDGQFVQIRLERQPQKVTLVERNGTPRSLESLSSAEHDQLYVALTLALIGAQSAHGSQLPLILDEPFLKQSEAQSAVMVGVINEFARAGHQVIVLTEDRKVWQRSATLGARRFDLELIRRAQAKADPVTIRQEVTPVIQSTNTRIIRETNDGHTTPILKLATVEGDPQRDDVFFLTESSRLNEFPVLGTNTSELFVELDIHTIGDLLIADSYEVARKLNRAGITMDTVRLWQIHTCLMCHIPNLTLDEAQVLAACGIATPSDIVNADQAELQQAIKSFLDSDAGSKFRSRGLLFTRARLKDIREGAHRYGARWQRAQVRYSNNDSYRDEPTVRKASDSNLSTRRTLRYYLAREHDVEAAPSIGPKTAKRLAKVGIRTVDDLLNADPLSTAEELDVSHISAEVLANWQHQARLVCQIPNLRGYGAQLLVGCGYTQPTQIASSQPDELIGRILAFCQTKEAQRILRSSNPPASERIAEWIKLAAQSRPLEAA